MFAQARRKFFVGLRLHHYAQLMEEHRIYLQPDIELWGTRVAEPSIVFTDMLVALVCFFAWYHLRKMAEPNSRRSLFAWFFFLMGTSAVIGGIVGHAFVYQFTMIAKSPGWVLGMFGVAALAQLSIGNARSFAPQGLTKTIFYTNIAALTISLWLLFSTLWFPVVEIYTAFGMLLIVTPLEAWSWARLRKPTSKMLLLAIPFMVLAAAAHALKISPGTWFTYFDIGHLCMCAALWCIYRGAIQSERMVCGV